MLPQPPLESSFTACLERERGKRPNPGVLKRCFYQWRISREREREREREVGSSNRLSCILEGERNRESN
jgi:hypothetical protein